MKKFLIYIFVSLTCIQQTYPIVGLLKEWWAINRRNQQEVYQVFFEPSEPAQEQQEEAPYTFANIAGEIPQDVREITEFIKNPERLTSTGAKLPKGILMYGPGGTGKTSIARAIAGEAHAAFFDASGSDFVELYVGVGPSRVRELFNKARTAVKSGTHSKAIIFIDEIDAIGGARTVENNSEYRNTLNELLKQLDGFTQDPSIFVIGATNNPHILDKALLRPGRFDRLVEIPLPSEKSREDIIRYYLSKINYTGADCCADLARLTPHCNGAELENLVNEAALLAAREGSPSVTEQHLRTALQKIIHQKRLR